MGLEDRPHVGTWVANRRRVIKYTPDCLVYINGDTALPGCAKCNGRIDLQRYITSVSVDAGVEPGAASGISISFAIPLHHADSIARDAKYLLRPALEAHIYLRGYFPVRGQFKDVMPEETDGVDVRQVVVYPYYHVFHGVVTSVDHAIEGGFQTISVNCASILNFWQYQNMSTSGSIFGARPNNSGVKTTMVGNTFNGKHPYAIIYQLFHDVAGAAAGVGFALSSQTSQKAKSDVLGDNLFSIALKYWQKRFSSRMMNLRMHGASGQVFNTAQAAFLSRLSGSQITNLVRGAYAGKKYSDPINQTNITSVAQNLGLLRQVKDPVTQQVSVQGPDVVQVERGVPKEGGGYEVSLAVQQAFVQNITEYGSVNLWESTYESKLAVAQKVCEITGFELYQDVDGDIVFKPPLYNLDTSSSRIYRIEDIDIYSFTSNEKEPEVTYMTCKGSQFKNMAGTGLENEWGVKGQFIDYRLVAQFGWREGTLETAYLSNSKAMFFTCVNRMAILNAAIKSGSLTIPQRPEIRPGYPVYVPFIDSFFYVTGFSHSFSFGGRCTTSLQLVAKRSKFHAPGSVGVDGIDGINLSNPILPEKPLQVIDGRGLPKWHGFPNVVMALDPDQVNPLHFMVGTDFQDISDPRVLRNLVVSALQYGLIVPAENGTEEDGPYVMFVDADNDQLVDPQGQTARDAMEESTSARMVQGEAGGKVPVEIGTFDSLTGASKKYAAFAKKEKALLGSSGQLAELEHQSTNIEAEIKVLQAQNSSLSSSDAEDKALIASNKKNIAELKKAQKKVQTTLRETRKLSEQEVKLEKDLENNPDVVMLKQMVQSLQSAFVEGNPDYPNGESTTAYLDILADKKANFTNGSLPGAYRYYSASHPDPAQQGMSTVMWATGKGPTGDGPATPLTTVVSVKGFVTPTKPGPDGLLPSAEIGTVPVVNGIHVLQGAGDGVLPTSSIKTLMFAKHSAAIEQGKTNYYSRQYYTGLDSKYREWVRANLQRHGDGITKFDTPIEEAFITVWERIKPAFDTLYADSYAIFDFPVELQHGGKTFETATTTINQVRDAIYGPFVKPRPALDLIVRLLQADLTASASSLLDVKWADVIQYDPEIELQLDDRIEAEKTFAAILNEVTKGQSQFKVGSSIKRNRDVEKTFYSPVFPVSDENGYEVYGSYRYGRGLGIELDNSLQALYEADPLQFATPEEVDKFLDVLSGDEPELSTFAVVDDDGYTTRVPVASRYEKITSEAQRILKTLTTNPEVPSSVVEYLDETTQSGVGLSNWAASSQEFTQKIIVGNIGYMLGDMKPHTEQEMCLCRAAEADIALEAFGTDFLEVLPPDVDQVTRYVGSQMFIRAQEWAQNQEQLRGKTRDLSLEVEFRQGENYRNTPDVPLPEGWE
jgi:hypothetical protein